MESDDFDVVVFCEVEEFSGFPGESVDVQLKDDNVGRAGAKGFGAKTAERRSGRGGRTGGAFEVRPAEAAAALE